MKLEFIATLASPEVRLRFLAMERSLRAVGCDLPLRVIPYNDGRFDLPPNSEWWLDSEMAEWLRKWKTHPTMRKYQCLVEANFQFVDSDVIFLRDPREALAPCEGFITSCGHWKNPNETLTAESVRVFSRMSTNWQVNVFNAGQWACDRSLYTFDELRERCESPAFRGTCLSFPHHDQPGVNLLVLASGVPVTNLTLPPTRMESTWAGDYPDEFEDYWTDPSRKPYLIHWAGCRMEERRSIDGLMEQFLTFEEKRAWALQVQQAAIRRDAACRSFRGRARKLKHACGQFLASLRSA